MSNTKYKPSSSEEVKAYNFLRDINKLDYFCIIKNYYVENGFDCNLEIKKFSFSLRSWLNIDTVEKYAAIALCVYLVNDCSDLDAFIYSLYLENIKDTNYDRTESFQHILIQMNKLAKQSGWFDEDIEFKLSFEYPETGILELPWKFIRPCDGYYELYHPNHYKEDGFEPYIFKHVGAKEDFNKINYESIKERWKIKVNCVNGRIKNIENFVDFTNLIQNELGEIDSPELDLSNPIESDANAAEKYANNYNRVKQKFPKDSEYISHLISIHNFNYDVKFCIEKICTYSSIKTYRENAFLFVIGENEKTIVVIYENKNEDRATYIFAVDRDVMDTAIESIVTFFSSYKCNKRQTLSSFNNILKEHGVTKQGKIDHDNIYRWKREIDDYLRWWLK